MKNYFYVGIGIIVFIIVALLSYGIYLNQRGENRITERLENNIIPLVGSKVKIREISPVYSMNVINLYSENLTDVMASTNGRITQEFVEKNSHVEAGSPIIFVLDEDFFEKTQEAEINILEAEAQFLRAKNVYKRYSELKKENAISLDKFEEAEINYKSAESKLLYFKMQKEQLAIRSNRQTVTSPIAGEVLTLYKKVGAYVTVGTSVALVGDFRTLRFTVPIDQKETRHISLGQEYIFSVDGNEALQKSYGGEYQGGNMGGDQVFTARIIKITPNLSEKASIRQVVWEVDNSSGILEPGMYSRVEMRPNLKFSCLTIPLTALTDESRSMVAVTDEEGRLSIKQIETGESDKEYIEVIAGLNEGDIVIVSDTRGIKEGTLVEVSVED